VLSSFREHAISYLVSSLIGIVITVIVFSTTAQPVLSEKIREKLVVMVLDEGKRTIGNNFDEASIDSFLSYKIGMDATESIVAYGSFRISGKIVNRWLSVYEPQEQNILDRLVGRSGFYSLKFLVTIPISENEELIAKKIEANDMDGDGVTEFIIRLESLWADSRSNGFLMLKKLKTNNWTVIGLPNISETINQIVSGKNPEPNGLEPILKPFSFFGDAKYRSKSILTHGPSKELLANLQIYEDVYDFDTPSGSKKLIMLRNGGFFRFINHPIKDYFSVAILSFIDDGRAVQGSHYATASVFHLDGEYFKPDANWNWGYFMLSNRPYRLKEIDFDSIIKAGIEAHKEGGSVFWHDSFERQ